jgi:hypothetical protein
MEKSKEAESCSIEHRQSRSLVSHHYEKEEPLGLPLVTHLQR